MHKLGKYYVPFMILIIVAVLFLFIQAMCDLKLPDYMSDIVNIGIQASGIQRVAPSVISENGLHFMEQFMEKEEQTLVNNAYQKMTKDNTEYKNIYPILESRDIYILKDTVSEEELENLDIYFSVSARTMMNLIPEMASIQGVDESILNQENKALATENVNANSINLDIEQLYHILPDKMLYKQIKQHYYP